MKLKAVLGWWCYYFKMLSLHFYDVLVTYISQIVGKKVGRCTPDLKEGSSISHLHISVIEYKE